MDNKFSIKTTISLLVVLVLGFGGIYIAYQVTQTQKKQETRSKAADTANAILVFNPSSINLTNTTAKNVELNITPNGHKVTAVQIVLRYNPAKIKINSLTPSASFPTVLQNAQIDNTSGTASIMLSPIKAADLQALPANQTAEGLTLVLPAKVLNFNFQILQAADAQIQLDPSQTIITSYAENNNVLKISSLTPLSLTANTTVNPALNFKIKFQGINTQKPDKTVKVTLVKGANVQTFDNIPVTADTNGIYSGQLTSLTPDTYTIYIKGFMHLQKKMEDNVTISANTTITKDWSGTELLAGDLNNDNSITIQDFGLLSQNYRTNSAVADLNLDGSVTIQDFGLLSQNYRAVGNQW